MADVIITGTPTVTSENSSATFAFTFSGGTAEYSLDGAAFVAATSPVVLSGLSPGGHVITIRVVESPSALQSFWWTVPGATTPVLTPIEAPTAASDLPLVDHVSAALARLCEQFKGPDHGG